VVRAALCALAALAMSAGAALAQSQVKPWKGKATLPLSRNGVDGRIVDLKAMQGRVVVVNFWATWCEPCREEMPSLQRLREKLAGRPFEVITVNFGESADKIAQFLEKEKVTLPVLLDTQKETAQDWGVGGLPMTFLVDARGRVRYSVFGELDWSEGPALALVEKLVAEAPNARH
jgi:thiol-disulfide isomerase/thioredoxin